MATIRIKRGSTDPSASQLTNAGELAVNTTNPGTKLFVKTASDSVTTPVWVGATIEASGTNGTTWSSDVNLATKKAIGDFFAEKSGTTFTGVVNFNQGSTAAGEIRLYEDTDDGSNYTGLRGAARTTDITYVMPTTDPTSGQVLSAAAPVSNVSQLSWASAGSATTVTTNSDNTNTTRYLVFGTTAQSGATLYVDDTTGPLSYNPSTGNLTVSGDLDVNGGDLFTTQTTATVFNTNATTVNAFGDGRTISIGHVATGGQTVNMFTGTTASSTYNFATGVTVGGDTKTINIGTSADGSANTNINIGNSAGEKSNITLQGYVTITKDATITGNLIVNGTTTTVNSTVTTLDDPIITLGGDTSTAETTKDRGVEFKWAGATVTMTNYIGNGTTTVTGTTSSTSGWIAGDIITISGATGAPQSNLNGTWTIASVPTGTTFTFVVAIAVTAGTYTSGLGTTVRSKNGFFGLDQSTGRFTFIPQASNSSEVFSGTVGDIEVADVIVTGGDITSGAAVASNLFGTTTTGNITVGNGLTTGTLTLGSATGSGTIAIGNTGTAAAQTVNIATATTGTITIGGTGATAVQLPTGKTKVGQTTLVQGVSGNITFPSSSGTLALTTEALSSSTTSTQSGYFGDIFLYDDSTPSHYLQITNSANLTAARSLSVNVNDANRTVSLSGDLTLANNLTTSGNFALTLTTSATTNATIPSGTITLVDLATSQTLTNKSLTAPRITTGSHIADANGNELIVFPSAVASAVNEITVSNTATGNSPSITASGGDTNINLVLAGKGTGAVTPTSRFEANCASRSGSAATTAYFSIIGPSDSTITASTEAVGVSITPGSRTWAAGALTTQREVAFAAPTITFASASTVTTAVNVDIANPIAGVNATITNAYALRAANTNITGTLLVNGTANVSFTNTGALSLNNTGTGSFTPSGSLTLGTAGQSTTMAGNITASTSNQTVTLSPTGTGSVSIQPAGSVTINPATSGTINNTSIGATTRSTGAFTTLGANNAVTIQTGTNNQSYTTTGAGTITITSGTAGSIDNMNIGATTAGTGRFSTITATSSITYNSAVIAAAGTTQAGATAITTVDVNFVTSGTGGVALPAAVAGRRIAIINRTAAAINVYPVNAGDDTIDGAAANAAYVLQSGEYGEFDCSSATAWFTNGTLDGGTY